ncbi:hypothetical protein MMC24_000933 [Lignoscripta atroalba]|nr:hypothetical protein [Lignoscripta atroalba]
MGDSVPIQRPVPRRTFQISSPSAESSAPPTPSPETSDPSYLDPRSNGGIPPSRTRSILNLTSSTLFGIYAPTGYEGTRDDGATPWGTGSQTPAQRKSIDDLRPPVLGPYQRAQVESRQPHHHPKPMDKLFPLALRTVLLFLFGIAYGVIVTHLHDNRTLAPVRVEGIDRYSWRYLMFWGLAGVGLGSLLPWVDVVWEEKVGKPQNSRGKEDEDTKEPGSDGTSHGDGPPASSIGSGLGADWNPVVRSIGAFVGIAFAIRKLPWQSTLQVSLTLALVNPVLWYVIDRSKPGFVLSALVGIAGTTVLLGVNPDIVPPPATSSPQANALNVSYEGLTGDRLISNESIGVGTWIASVLFCSCVCFGNIGRRLALGSPGRRKSIS